MSGNLSVEGLVIDDSFSNYCFQKNEADSLYWEKYLQVNPSEKEKIEEAKQLVLGLAAMLKLDEKGLEEIKGQPAKVIPFPIQKRKKNKKIVVSYCKRVGYLCYIGCTRVSNEWNDAKWLTDDSSNVSYLIMEHQDKKR